MGWRSQIVGSENDKKVFLSFWGPEGGVPGRGGRGGWGGRQDYLPCKDAQSVLVGWRSQIVGSEPNKSVFEFLGAGRGGSLVGGRKGGVVRSGGGQGGRGE